MAIHALNFSCDHEVRPACPYLDFPGSTCGFSLCDVCLPLVCLLLRLVVCDVVAAPIPPVSSWVFLNPGPTCSPAPMLSCDVRVSCGGQLLVVSFVECMASVPPHPDGSVACALCNMVLVYTLEASGCELSRASALVHFSGLFVSQSLSA